jgi:hypothetical protein
MRNEACPESVRPVIRPVIPVSIRPVMVCLLRRGGENSGVQTRLSIRSSVISSVPSSIRTDAAMSSPTGRAHT